MSQSSTHMLCSTLVSAKIRHGNLLHGHPYSIGRHGYRSALADSYNTSVHFPSSLFLFWSVSFVSLRCISLSISLDILSSVMTADGRKYIREKRAKTNNEAFIPLHPIAEQIMSLYNTADDSKPVFPLSSRDSMWFEFHSLGVALGINENLTAHVARHTFGVNMVTSGISMESVAKMMGHSNLRSTQIYAVITDNKISIDMDKLMQRRKTKETDQKRNKEDEK